MPITQETSETNCVIRLEGDVDVACSSEFKRMLVDGIASGKEVQVDASLATDFDVTAVQLLWATTREAKKNGTSFQISPSTEALRNAFAAAAIEDFSAPGTIEVESAVTAEKTKIPLVPSGNNR